MVNQTTLFNKGFRNTKHLCKNVQTQYKDKASLGQTDKHVNLLLWGQTDFVLSRISVTHTKATIMLFFPPIFFVLLSNTKIPKLN